MFFLATSFFQKKTWFHQQLLGLIEEKNANLPSSNETWLSGESLQMAVPIGKCSKHMGEFSSKTCWINKR